MEPRIDRSAIAPSALAVCRRLAEKGHRAWIVGGSIRDLLLDASSATAGAPSRIRSDWDIATDARPEQVMRIFPRVVPTGVQHGTVTVLVDGDALEVTTLRGETTYTDGRHPDSIHFVDDITDDLARRDFTINAIAYDPEGDRLIDPHGGLADLRAKTLRAVGDPSKRFAEDGLRILRAARFVATLEVALDPATEHAIEPALDTYRKVSAERVRDEWTKAMKARKPSRAFEVMKDHGMLAITAPELVESVGCQQNRFHAYDVWGHAMACLDGCPPDPVLRVAGLLHDVGKPRSREWSDKNDDYTFYEHERIGAEMSDAMLERLRFSKKDRERAVALVRHHLICYEPSWTDAAVRRWLRRVGPDLTSDLYALNRADVLAKGRDASLDLERLAGLEAHVLKVFEQGSALTVKALAIDGHDLTELGLKPGPLYGEILRALLDEVVEDPTRNERAVLLERARQIALEKA